jgi:hypothetical protein
VTITGQYYISDMNAWIHSLFPEMSKIDDSDEITLAFRNSFVGSVLFISYRSGTAEFKSDSISTLNIIKDHISKEANYRNIMMDFQWEIEKKTIKRILQLLDEKVKHYAKIDN